MTTAAEQEILPQVSIEQIEVFADDLDYAHAASVYKEHGCLVVRGLMDAYVAEIAEQIEAKAQESIAMLDQATKCAEGWFTPNGTLFLPAPENFDREQQIMCLGVNYRNSAAFFKAAFEPRLVRLTSEILGPNVELFHDGQCLYKEPVGGHPKLLHQDAAYFQHDGEGPVAALTYVVDTNLQNGCLHVVPGSHKLGLLDHVDTFSHLGLDPQNWPWERSLPVTGRAGDTVLFNVETIHGSKENHSDAARPVFINRYRNIEDYTVAGGTSVSNRGEVAKEKPPEQKGLMVSGYRPHGS